MRTPHRTPLHRSFLTLCLSVLWLASFSAANAQEPSTDTIKAGAYDARQAADAARARLEEANRAAAEATAQLEAAEQAAVAAETRASEAAAAAPAQADVAEQLEAAREEARVANEKADAALAAVEEIRAQFAFDRKGFYVGVGAYWAPEAFDTSVSVDDSWGRYATVGYRLAPHFALEVRGDWLDDFDLRYSSVIGKFSGWGIMGNAKVFLMTGRIQPFVAFGVGAMIWDLDFVELESRASEKDSGTDVFFQFAGGIDFYVTPSVVLNLEGAYASVGGSVSGVQFGQIGGGLTFRF